MPARRNSSLPIAKLDIARDYLIAEINSLRALRGTVWVFVCAATMIDYLASLSKGRPSGRAGYIEFIKEEMKTEYANFRYEKRHRKPGTGIDKKRGNRLVYVPRTMTHSDLPEQMYYMFRCGLVHGFSLVPSPQELKNGGRERSITINSKTDAIVDGKAHLERFSKPPQVVDSIYFIDEDLLDDLVLATNKLFADSAKHANISKMLKERPFIWPL